MAGHTTEEAIQAVAAALSKGMSEMACRFDLVADGFKPVKASIIVRWAKRMNKTEPKAKPFSKRETAFKKKEAP